MIVQGATSAADEDGAGALFLSVVVAGVVGVVIGWWCGRRSAGGGAKPGEKGYAPVEIE